MAFNPRVAEAQFYGPSQQLPKDAGPYGRLASLLDARIRKYVGSTASPTTGATTPSQIQIDARDGFVSFVAAAKSIIDGSNATVNWSNPQILAAFGKQMVAITGGQPVVQNGTNYTAYPDTTVLPRVLDQDIFHVSQKVLAAPDYATISGTECSTWTESVDSSTGPITTTFVGFKSEDGAWLVQPTALYVSSSSATRTMAKCTQDGSVFFVFWNDDSVVHINAYDPHGALLGSSSGPTDIALHAPPPGTWDIVAASTASPHTGTVLFAQSVSPTADSGVFLTSVGWSGSAITTSSALVNTIHCTGPLGFLVNHRNGLAYLGTGRKATSTTMDLWGYEITNLANSKEYNVGGTVDLTQQSLDSIGGVVANSSLDLTISFGFLPAAAATVGPTYDPARRYLLSVTLARAGGGTVNRTTQGLAQVTRPFLLDGNYYSLGYWQSGSGSVITPQSQSITVASFDSMIGAPQQVVPVQAGDYVQGSPINAASNTVLGLSIYVSSAHAAEPPQTGDFVNLTTATGVPGLPNGSYVLIWKLQGLPPGSSPNGSRLVVSGTTGATGANATWDVLGVDGSGRYVTSVSPTTGPGNVVPIGNLANGVGTVTLQSMTAYTVNDLSPFINTATGRFFAANNTPGTVTVTGGSPWNNVSNITIQRVYYGQPGANFFGTGTGPWGAVWVVTGSQLDTTDAFAAVISPNQPNTWNFAASALDFTDDGTSLVVGSDVNAGTMPITAVPSSTQVTTGGSTNLVSEVWSSPLPTVTLQLTTQNAYTFKLANATPSFIWQGGTVLVQGAKHAANNTTYGVTQINGDGSFVAIPTDGSSDQINEAFDPSSVTITVFFFNNVNPIVQPTWFLVPLTGTQPIVGRWEYGSAFADWRVEGDALGPNLYPCSLSSPSTLLDGSPSFLVPFRAKNVTEALGFTVAGQTVFTEEVTANTVGLKRFSLGQPGQAFAGSSELAIPGPMATTFPGFLESGFNLAPECPFFVSQSTGSTGQLGLTPGATYIYQLALEMASDDGDLIYSIVSPPLSVTMGGTNNIATIGGRLLFPLDSSGNPIPDTYGPTTRNGALALYRTAITGGIPTTEKFLITSGLAPNQLAPISTLNPSGFSFPDSFSFLYTDANTDVGLPDSQDLYSDSELPHHPAPAFSRGFTYKDRDYALAYDGSVWVSAPKVEGQATWWHPSFRWAFPTTDKPKTVGFMEGNVFVFCERTIYQIPIGDGLPAANGTGALPTPTPLPWQDGSKNGFAASIPGMVVYDSSSEDGGVWAITRTLQRVWLSQPMVDQLTGNVAGFATDGDQNLYVQQDNTSAILVYQHLAGVWSVTNPPTSPVLISSYLGNLVYQDSNVVSMQTPGALNDQVNGTTTGIAPGATFAKVTFQPVRGLKMIWGLQLVGDYKGAHRVLITIGYPDDGYPDQVIPPFTPDPTKPYIIPFYLENEEVSSFTLTISVDFVGVGTPGASCSWELIAAEIGVEGGRLPQLPDSSVAV